MKMLRSAIIAAGLALSAASAFAQVANPPQTVSPIVNPLVGTELVQISPANGAINAYTSVSSLRDGRGYKLDSPATGATETMTTSQSALSLTPAGTIAALTVQFPPTIIDGKFITIFTTQTITALTLATTNTATINNPVTTLAANGSVSYIYNSVANAWSRIQ